MELLPEQLEHDAEIHSSWNSRIADHTMWLASRTLFVIFMLAIAFLARVPFERLIRRDVVVEMEEREKQKALDEYEAIRELVLAAGKFEPPFIDSAQAVLTFDRNPNPSLGVDAQNRHETAVRALQKLRDSFGNRRVNLGDDFEESMTRTSSKMRKMAWRLRRVYSKTAAGILREGNPRRSGRSWS